MEGVIIRNIYRYRYERGRLESDYLYFFRNARLGAIYPTPALHSDFALLKCLRVTQWRMGQIIYEGKDRVPKSLRNCLFGPEND